MCQEKWLLSETRTSSQGLWGTFRMAAERGCRKDPSIGELKHIGLDYTVILHVADVITLVFRQKNGEIHDISLVTSNNEEMGETRMLIKGNVADH